MRIDVGRGGYRYGWLEIATPFATDRSGTDENLGYVEVPHYAIEDTSGVPIQRIVISLTEDDTDTGDRAANSVSFFADTGSGWETVFTVSPAQPYKPAYGDYAITIEALFDTAITTDKWAVEFESPVTGGNSGVRVIEVDGYATVPEPASVLMLLLGGALIGLKRRLYPHF